MRDSLRKKKRIKSIFFKKKTSDFCSEYRCPAMRIISVYYMRRMCTRECMSACMCERMQMFCGCLWSQTTVLIRRLCLKSKETTAEKRRWENLKRKRAAGISFTHKVWLDRTVVMEITAGSPTRICVWYGVCKSTQNGYRGFVWMCGETVRLCWLVKGPGGQKRNNANFKPSFFLLSFLSTPDFFPQSASLLSLSLSPPFLVLFLAVSWPDEVRQEHYQVSGMASGHCHQCQLSLAVSHGRYQPSKHD